MNMKAPNMKAVSGGHFKDVSGAHKPPPMSNAKKTLRNYGPKQPRVAVGAHSHPEATSMANVHLNKTAQPTARSTANRENNRVSVKSDADAVEPKSVPKGKAVGGRTVSMKAAINRSM